MLNIINKAPVAFSHGLLLVGQLKGKYIRTNSEATLHFV